MNLRGKALELEGRRIQRRRGCDAHSSILRDLIADEKKHLAECGKGCPKCREAEVLVAYYGRELRRTLRELRALDAEARPAGQRAPRQKNLATA